MNHLAHAFLASDSAESLIGNLAGDFFKGRLDHHDIRLRDGIRMHRSVDAFTDRHPSVHASKKLFTATYRHYSGIIVDVVYDHLLATSWRSYSDEPLPYFARRVYATLERRPDLIPPAFAVSLPRMIGDDWLVRYQGVEGVSRALHFLGRRLRGAPRLDGAVSLLDAHRTELEEHFQSFFPDVLKLKN